MRMHDNIKSKLTNTSNINILYGLVSVMHILQNHSFDVVISKDKVHLCDISSMKITF